jgi:RNA polymerase sigma-70 factor (ECF subfamily)
MQPHSQDVFVTELMPHLDELQRVARRLGDPDDLIQQTALQALVASHQYRRGSNPRAWLYRILVNVAMTEHRGRARARRLFERLEREQPAEAEDPVDAEQARAVRSALERLRPRDRQVLELADVEGCRYREIAHILDVPVGTVMSRLCRARRRLRACLDA